MGFNHGSAERAGFSAPTVRTVETGARHTYHNMHSKAHQMSRCLVAHPFGTSGHYGNPSILFGKDCEAKEEKEGSNVAAFTLAKPRDKKHSHNIPALRHQSILSH
ncbi:hypothetical protein AAFF_G00008350 [Aldrovandia affinis]|uniref:Uncharacterized protein n=1 Tax=Aldrovandia affinis TaxID=143900 RepID=A0AAD7WZP1_9TELE|nr:hypothetical protein AAFF_G00008350 [Aldrovandia affinis]